MDNKSKSLNLNILKAKPKLSAHVVKRYDRDLDLFVFFNAKTGMFWETDYSTGMIISALDGSLKTDNVFKILAQNSNTPKDKISSTLSEILLFLIKEEFVNV